MKTHKMSDRRLNITIIPHNLLKSKLSLYLSPRHVKSAFTIVELLIVVVVIAILAAITVVTYNGIMLRAASSVLLADAKSVSSQLEREKIEYGLYPVSVHGLRYSDVTTLQLDSDGSEYCLTAMSSNIGIPPVTLSSRDNLLREGLCDGHEDLRAGITSAGVQWTLGSTPDDNLYWLRDVAFGNGVYVAVSSNSSGKVMTSSDGVNWTMVGTPTTVALYQVEFGNGIFLATGAQGRVVVSSDGVNWTITTTSSGITTSPLTYGNGTFLSLNGNQARATQDGVTWTSSAIDIPSGITWPAIFNKGYFRVYLEDKVAVSRDGIEWTTHNIDSPYPIKRVAFGNGIYVSQHINAAGGGYGLVSTDGIHWSAGVQYYSNFEGSVLSYGGGRFIVLSGIRSDRLWTSTDGLIWSQGSNGDSWGGWRDVIYSNGCFFAVGSGSGNSDRAGTRVMRSCG